MQLISVDVPLDFNVFLLGDQHIGARLHDEDGWQAVVEMIHSTDSPLIIMMPDSSSDFKRTWPTPMVCRFAEHV